MKVFIALCCLIVCAQANYSPAVVSSKIINTGTSTQTRSQDAAGNYAFSYNEQHATGGSSRKEQGDAWNNVQGSYSLNVGDGRQRVVKYVADGHGFRASIKTNEPGIVAKAPADVYISTPHGSAYGNSGYGDVKSYGHDLKGDYSHGYENSYAPANYGHDNYYGSAKAIVADYGHGHGYGLGNGYRYAENNYGHNNYGHNNYGHNNYGHNSYGNNNYGHNNYGHNYGHGYDNHYPSTTTLVGGYTQSLKGDHGYGNNHNYANTYDGHYGSSY